MKKLLILNKHYYLNSISFLSAFLLFQLELIIAKIFLPVFGGSYLVWGACVVFFQAILLLGYLYAHFVVSRYGIEKYRLIHLILFIVPLFLFPGKPLPEITTHPNLPMVADVFLQLLTSIGPIFFLLATMAVITQSWLADSTLPQKSFPYRLYAMSNWGSFVGLISYPFVFEFILDIPYQIVFWRICYLILLALNVIALCVIKVKSSIHTNIAPEHNSAYFSRRLLFKLILFSAASVIAFLSVTNIITYAIAPIPLLWIIPLGIYLLSYALTFKNHPWCPTWIIDKFFYITAFALVFFFLSQGAYLDIFLGAIVFYFLLFCTCVYCSYHLISLKPKNKNALTAFYAYIALGGFFGGLFTTWVVPPVSTLLIEFPLAYLVIYFALMLDDEQKINFLDLRYIAYMLALILFWPLVFKQYNIFGLLILFLSFKFIFKLIATKKKILFLGVLSLVIICPFINNSWQNRDILYRLRNYYGLYTIYCEKGAYFLMHGTTVHGGAFLDRKKAMEPITYFHRNSPIGEILTSNKFSSCKNIGVVGLGTGVLAAYGRPGQAITFFELDPVVGEIANNFFPFLNQSKAKIRCVYGDARKSLQEIPDKSFDLFIIDAFSSDSIPLHLLTIEAIQEYFKKMTDDGLLIMHTSNKYIFFEPLIDKNARQLGLNFAYKNCLRVDKKKFEDASTWSALTKKTAISDFLLYDLKWQSANKKRPIKFLRAWTDNYSSILCIIKIRALQDIIKNFRPFDW